jgi:hypothetical protein
LHADKQQLSTVEKYLQKQKALEKIRLSKAFYLAQ